jgi:hypothetical protein
MIFASRDRVPGKLEKTRIQQLGILHPLISAFQYIDPSQIHSPESQPGRVDCPDGCSDQEIRFQARFEESPQSSDLHSAARSPASQDKR